MKYINPVIGFTKAPARRFNAISRNFISNVHFLFAVCEKYFRLCFWNLFSIVEHISLLYFLIAPLYLSFVVCLFAVDLIECLSHVFDPSSLLCLFSLKHTIFISMVWLVLIAVAEIQTISTPAIGRLSWTNVNWHFLSFFWNYLNLFFFFLFLSLPACLPLPIPIEFPKSIRRQSVNEFAWDSIRTPYKLTLGTFFSWQVPGIVLFANKFTAGCKFCQYLGSRAQMFVFSPIH